MFKPESRFLSVRMARLVLLVPAVVSCWLFAGDLRATTEPAAETRFSETAVPQPPEPTGTLAVDRPLHDTPSPEQEATAGIEAPPPDANRNSLHETPSAWGPITVLSHEVQPGQRADLFLLASESVAGTTAATPVTVLHGARPGLVLCVTAGIHGDELNGVVIVREIIEKLDPASMCGTLIGVPIVNLHGFHRSSRYLPDRRDLNRYFPGSPRGSSASRIAHALFDGVIRHCDALVDLHSGSLHRSNIAQIRGDLRHPGVRMLARGFAAEVVLHNPGRPGTLRRAALDAGIPAIIYEAGEPMRFQKREIDLGVRGLENLLAHLGMIEARPRRAGKQVLFYESHWVRADRGGILVASVDLGARVREGDILGTIADPLEQGRAVIISPYEGRLIGMTLAPVVIPGDATFHIGIEAPLTPEFEVSPAPTEEPDEERPE